MRCVACGCTDYRACMTEDGPCYWVELSAPVCSGCASRWPREEDVAAIDRRIRSTLDELTVGTTREGAFVWLTPAGVWTP